MINHRHIQYTLCIENEQQKGVNLIKTSQETCVTYWTEWTDKIFAWKNDMQCEKSAQVQYK